MARLNEPGLDTGTDRRALFRGVAGVLIIIVAWLAFRPTTGADQGLPWDKANHALAFFVLTIVCARGWPGSGFWRLAAVMLAAGTAIEIIQGLPLVGRDADVWDVVADMAGFVLGWILTIGLRRIDRRRSLRG